MALTAAGEPVTMPFGSWGQPYTKKGEANRGRADHLAT
jgi:hypothetical protein